MMASRVGLATLYKSDSTGKIREWTISCYKDSVPYYEVEHGVVGGAMVTSRTEFTSGKNTGRANSTTAWDQCLAEARSEWNKKLNRKGYVNRPIISNISAPIKIFKRFSPMLAKSYNAPGADISKLKDGHHIKFPCYFQPKLDGIRCIARTNTNSIGVVTLWSRQNKKFTSLPHIEETLSKLSGLTANIHLDGELYIHDEEFQSLTSAIKRDDPSPDSSKIEYHIYDVYDSSNPNWEYEDRKKWLETNIKPGFRKLKPVYTERITSAAEIKKHLHDQIRRGYEGIMLRNVDGIYKVDARSADLQKVKLFMDEEFPIVGATENSGKMKGQCSFICKTKDGNEFSVKPEGDEVLRKQYWRDWQAGKLNGALLTVRFFAWTTSANSVPRFPVGVTIRDYE